MNRGTMFWGSILILAGGIFLLQNFNLLGNINAWTLIWPAFLILMGIWILAGRALRGKSTAQHTVVSLDGATRARLRLNHGAGRITLTAASLTDNLVEGDFGGGLDVDRRRDGDLLDAKLSVPTQAFPFVWGAESLDWILSINRSIPLTLDINTGASESNIDLSDLQLSELRLQTGASSSNVTLPANAGFTRVSVESGVASVSLRIPAGVAARIRTRSGLASINVDTSRFPRAGDVYQSPDFDTAANKADIDIQTGVASADIR